MPRSNTSGTRRSRQNALKAACLSAGLVTAFGAAPAQATMVGPANSFQATNGDQTTPIYDAYYLNATAQAVSSFQPADMTPYEGELPSPVLTSQPAPLTGTYDMVVFAQDTTASDLAGMTFESAFLSGTNYNESEVVNYIQSGMTDTSSTDQSAYNTFLQNLTTNFFDGPENVFPEPTDPINAYQFTNGQFIGTVPSSQLTTAASPTTGFGLVSAQTAVPEPGAIALWMVGAVPLAAVVISRRRRTV